MSARSLDSADDGRSGCVCATLTTGLRLPRPEVSDRVVDRAIDIANRLRFVCAHLPPQELIELAIRMAAIELKYACAEEQPAPLTRA